MLDPFAGTGTFIARLIEDESLIPADKLPHKYAHELHSNEILLLAYYIMVVNIEYAYHARTGEYKEFAGALLTDTFQMSEDDNRIDDDFFQDNSIRMLEQQELDITVVVGNPPYSAGQTNANDNNANEHYPTLDERIRQTYSAGSKATNKNSIMDSYIRAFRWASDRIVRNGDNGIVCFVSNAGWLRSAAGEGVRRAFVEEFNSIYVLDLRGNARTQGEERRKERDNVFGMGTRTPIAITMLVKNPNSGARGVIHYVDVGDYKTQRDKLYFAISAASSEPDWVSITPDIHGDWLNQRDDTFYSFAPIGITKFKEPAGMFATWSAGLKTQRHPWCWNFSLDAVVDNTRRLITNTNEQLIAAQGNQENLERDATKYSWTRAFMNRVKDAKTLDPRKASYICGVYRPFCRQWLCYDSELNEMTYQQHRLFPLASAERPKESTSSSASNSADLSNTVRGIEGKSGVEMIGQHGFSLMPNIAITMASTGRHKPSPLLVDTISDLGIDIDGAQCYPLYWYEKLDDRYLFSNPTGKIMKDAWGNRYIRHDAITDRTLGVFRAAYPAAYATRPKSKGGSGLNKEDIFHYVYGILHSSVYREKYAANLAKELPLIPLTKYFEEFSNAGRQLAHLHLHYEELEPWPTVSTGILPGADPGPVKKIRWAKKKDPETGKRVNDYTKLVYNTNVIITGIPEEAQGYVVNGRSPLDWVIDRYQVKTDKKSGITNDPNDYSDDPCYIINLITRLVRVSMETQQIVQSLPTNIDEIPHLDNWPVEWTVQP